RMTRRAKTRSPTGFRHQREISSSCYVCTGRRKRTPRSSTAHGQFLPSRKSALEKLHHAGPSWWAGIIGLLMSILIWISSYTAYIWVASRKHWNVWRADVDVRFFSHSLDPEPT